MSKDNLQEEVTLLYKLTVHIRQRTKSKELHDGLEKLEELLYNYSKEQV